MNYLANKRAAYKLLNQLNEEKPSCKLSPRLCFIFSVESLNKPKSHSNPSRSTPIYGCVCVCMVKLFLKLYFRSVLFPTYTIVYLQEMKPIK